MAEYKRVFKKGKKYTVTQSDGTKVTKRKPGRWVKIKIKDTSKGKKIITGERFDPNKHEVQMGIKDIKTGVVIQKAGVVRKTPSKRRTTISRPAFSTGTIDITDTKTGVRTISKVDLRTGKTLSSERSQAPKIQLASLNFRKQEQAKINLRNQLRILNLRTSRDQNIVNKVLTGQTITGQENLQYDRIIKEKGDKLTARQIQLLKDAPKDIATGLYEVGKEIVTMSLDAVKGSYNYGKTLSDRFEKGESNPLKNDIVKLSKGVVSVSKFVSNNPKESAAIVGLFAASSGEEFGNAFIKNPVKTLTKAVAYLFPGTIIKGGVAIAKTGAKITKKGFTKAQVLKKNLKLDKLIATEKKRKIKLEKAKLKTKSNLGKEKLQKQIVASKSQITILNKVKSAVVEGLPAKSIDKLTVKQRRIIKKRKSKITKESQKIKLKVIEKPKASLGKLELPTEEKALKDLVLKYKDNPTLLKILKNRFKKEKNLTIKIIGNKVYLKKSIDIKKGVTKKVKAKKKAKRSLKEPMSIKELKKKYTPAIIEAEKKYETFTKEIIKGKKISTLTKTDVKKILETPKGKLTLQTKLKNIEIQIQKNVVKIEEFKQSAKGLSKQDKKKAGKIINKLIKINQELIRNKKALPKQIKIPKKELDPGQFKKRAKLFNETLIKQKPEVVSISSSPNTLTIKTNLGDIVFELNLPKGSLRKGKRGRLQSPINITFQKSTIKKYGIKNIKTYQDKLKNAARSDRYINKSNRMFRDSKKEQLKIIQLSKKKGVNKLDIKRLNKSQKQLKVLEQALEKATLQRWLKILARMTATKQIQIPKQIQLSPLEQILKDIHKEIVDIKPEVPKLPKKPTKPYVPIKPYVPKKKPRVPKKPKPPKKPKLPRKPRVPKKPKVPRIPRIRLSPVSIKQRKVQSTNLGQIEFILTDPKTKQRDVITIKTGLPYLEAKKLARDTTDGLLFASTGIKAYGKTKNRLTITKVDMKKFRPRKGKDIKVREFVEKRKYRLDKPGEVSGILKTRLRKLVQDKIQEIKQELKSQGAKILPTVTKKKKATKKTSKPKKSQSKTPSKRVSSKGKAKKKQKSSKKPSKEKSTKKSKKK